MSSLDESQIRYLDELIAAASVLVDFDSAAQAEAWVSGAVAEWTALGADTGRLRQEIADAAPLAAALIEWFLGGDRVTGDVPWLADLGRQRLVRVLELVDADAPDEVGMILEYALDEVHDHDVSVSLVGGVLTGITVGPAGLADGLADDDESHSLTTREIEPTAGVDAVAEALAHSLADLSPASEANVPLLVRRVGADANRLVVDQAASRAIPERDAEDDRWCVDVVRSALRDVLASSAPAAVEDARRGFVARIDRRDPDALTVAAVAGLAGVAGALIDLGAFCRVVGAYIHPVDLAAHTNVQFEALVELEPVDWVGVVLGMARGRAGAAPIDGMSLVTFINRAPEITSTIPKADAPRLAWTFEQMLFSWEVTGVLDEAGQVTAAGRWLLPHGFVAALAPGG